jgi:hypothetical protein
MDRGRNPWGDKNASQIGLLLNTVAWLRAPRKEATRDQVEGSSLRITYHNWEYER